MGLTCHGNVQGLAALSNRELGILALVGESKTSKEIAFDLSLSLQTIAAHRASIKRKLNLRTGAEVAAFAVAYIAPVRAK